MRPTIFLAGAGALVLGVGGCGTGSAARDARLTGLVRLCGGPAPGRCFTEPVHVTVVDAQKRVVGRSHPMHGRFSFDLAPGAYTVSAAASGYVLGTATVDVVAGKTALASITNGDVK